MINVQLADGRILRVQTDDDETAATAARNFLENENAERVRQRPLTGLFAQFGQSARESAAAPIGMAAATDAAVRGGGETLESIRSAIAGAPSETTRPAELRDFASQPLAATGNMVGQAFGSIAGGLAGTAAGAVVGGLATGGPGAVPGAIAGTVGGGMASSTDQLFRALIDAGVERQRAGQVALMAGPAIGALEIVPAVRILKQALGDTVTDQGLQQIVRSLTRAGVSGAGRGAVAEAPAEIAGDLARTGVVAAETGVVPTGAELAEQAAMSGIGGAIGGAGMGGAGAIMQQRRTNAAAQPAAPATPPPPTETAQTEPAPAVPVAEPPTPFNDPVEAYQYLQGTREGMSEEDVGRVARWRPTTRLSPEQILTLANTAQDQIFQETQEATRTQAIREFFGDEPGDDDTTVLRPLAAERFISNLVRVATDGTLDLRDFTPEEAADAALLPYGSSFDELTKAQQTALNKRFAQLQKAQFLRKNDDGNYSLNRTNAQRVNTGEARANAITQRTGVAEPTALQRNAGDAIDGKLTLDAKVNEDGEASYTLKRGGKPVQIDQDSERVFNQMIALREAQTALREAQAARDRISVADTEAGREANAQIAEATATIQRLGPFDLKERVEAMERIARANSVLGRLSPTDTEAWQEATAQIAEATEALSQAVNNLEGLRDNTGIDGFALPEESGIGISNELRSRPNNTPVVPSDTPPSQITEFMQAAAARQPVAREEALAPVDEWLGAADDERTAKTAEGRAALAQARENRARAQEKAAAALLNPMQQASEQRAQAGASRIGSALTSPVITPAQARQALGQMALGPTVSMPFFRAQLQRVTGRPVTIPEARQAADDLAIAGDLDRVQGGYKLPKQGGRANLAARTNEELIPATPRDTEQALADFQRVTGGRGKVEFRPYILYNAIDDTIVDALRENDVGVTEVNGLAKDDLAILSMNPDMPITQIAIHEGMHVAEAIGLIPVEDVGILNDNRDVILRAISKEIPNLDTAPYGDNIPSDEVRAWGLNAYVMRQQRFNGPVDRVYAKVANVLARIRNLLQGKGYRTWQDVYADFHSGRTAQSNTPTGVSTLGMDGKTLLATRQKERKRVEQSNFDRIAGVTKWISSPIMSLGRVDPALRPASAVAQDLYYKAQEFTRATDGGIAKFYGLNDEESKQAVQVWSKASETRKAPDFSGVPQNVADAIRDGIAAMQSAFDHMVEAYYLNEWKPNDDMKPAQRRRIEAMWKRNEGKRLWQIPPNELRAANPAAYRELAEFQKARNPYYMPMMMPGTHFVAAYERNKDGSNGAIKRMAIYTPSNLAMRLQNRVDEEAYFKAELAKEFGDATKYNIMSEGRQIASSKDASDLVTNLDFVQEFVSSYTDLAKDKNAKDIVKRIQARVDKAQLSRMFRPNNGILMAVHPQNEAAYLKDTLPQYLVGASKLYARRYTQKAFEKAIAPLSNNDREYLQTHRDYSTTPTEAFAGLRTLSFYTHLGLAVDTAAINALQPFQMTLPMLARDVGIGKATKAMLQVAADFSKGQGFFDMFKTGANEARFHEVLKKQVRDPDDLAAINRAVEMGVFAPVYTNESRGQFTIEAMRRMGAKNPGQRAQFMNKVTSVMGYFMQMFEQYNRASAFLAAYRLAKQNPQIIERANKLDSTGIANAYEYALAKVRDTQFLTSKEDRALVQRFTPAAEVATQFMSFPLKMTEQFVFHMGTAIRGIKNSDPEAAKAGALGAGLMASNLLMLGGVFALPGAEILREALERLIGFAFGSTQNFDYDMRKGLAEMGLPMAGAEAVVRGIPHALGLPSLARRVAINPVDVAQLESGSLLLLLGPSGALVEGPMRAATYARTGDYWQMAAALMPRAAGNVVRAVGTAGQGEDLRTMRGNTIIPGPDFTWRDTVGMAIGLPPSHFVNRREAVTYGVELNQAARSATEKANIELAGYLVRSMRESQRGRAEASQEAINDFGKAVQRILERNNQQPDPTRWINLNMQAIQRRAIDDFYGLSSAETMTRRTNERVRPEIESIRETFRLN